MRDVETDGQGTSDESTPAGCVHRASWPLSLASHSIHILARVREMVLERLLYQLS